MSDLGPATFLPDVGKNVNVGGGPSEGDKGFAKAASHRSG